MAEDLLTWEQTFPWQRDNEYILTSYRKASFSLKKSLQSILGWHNETANIWSHLLGALVFLFLCIHFFMNVLHGHPSAPLHDAMAVGIFYVSVATCFILSTLFHTFSDQSPAAHTFGNELDHLGIVFVIWGSGVPSDYFGFYCDLHIRNTYWLLVTTTAITCAIFTLRPKFRRPAYRTMRFVMYCFLGSSLFLPVFHGMWLYGWSAQDERMGLRYFFGLGALNFSGAAIYAARIPERWVPRRFDLLGSSHNIMHILVVCGAFSHLCGLLQVLKYWEAKRALGNNVCST